MQRRIQIGTIGILLALLLVIVVALQAQTRAPIPAPVTITNGRWQVVNGRPEAANTIMLLDTATGTSWILCEDKAKDGPGDSWCPMSMYVNKPNVKP